MYVLTQNFPLPNTIKAYVPVTLKVSLSQELI